ncbi:MAG: hypothetical protein H7124_11620, partial [Phycisphaerales bacterium]|nr:hypothetical protein [Hyphomonadaceae bacterium]
MKPHQPLIRQPEIAAFTATLSAWLMWLVSVALLLGAPQRSRLLRRFVARYERWTERVVFLIAAGQVRAPSHRRTQRPMFAPQGFRRTPGVVLHTFKHARVRLRGGALRDRLLRLADVLAAP